MVNGYGKEVLKGLCNEYAQGLDRGELRQLDVDVKLRVGEALGIVVKSCGSALGSYSTSLFDPRNPVSSDHIS